MQLLTMKEVVTLLKIDRRQIVSLIKSDKFPKPVDISFKKFRWKESDILKWIEELKYINF